MKLSCKLRHNMNKQLCVAPFINGHNVWDIPQKEWTPDVQQAIKHAFELGVEHAAIRAEKKCQEVKWELAIAREGWPEPKESRK